MVIWKNVLSVTYIQDLFYFYALFNDAFCRLCSLMVTLQLLIDWRQFERKFCHTSRYYLGICP